VSCNQDFTRGDQNVTAQAFIFRRLLQCHFRACSLSDRSNRNPESRMSVPGTASLWQQQARAMLDDHRQIQPHAARSYWELRAPLTRFGSTVIARGLTALVQGIVPGLYPWGAGRRHWPKELPGR
jgi:hypothetical protein